jgi:hypothetical protein
MDWFVLLVQLYMRRRALLLRLHVSTRPVAYTPADITDAADGTFELNSST